MSVVLKELATVSSGALFGHFSFREHCATSTTTNAIDQVG